MGPTIPEKLYFKIGEVAKLAEVAPHVLRYWESEFKEICPKRANSKQRLYRREDVETVLLVKDLLHKKGYTISGAKKFLTKRIKERQNSTSVVDTGHCMEKIKKELLAVKELLSKEE